MSNGICTAFRALYTQVINKLDFSYMVRPRDHDNGTEWSPGAENETPEVFFVMGNRLVITPGWIYRVKVRKQLDFG